MSGISTKGSEGKHSVLMFVDTSPRSYLVEAQSKLHPRQCPLEHQSIAATRGSIAYSISTRNTSP
jgi:hypothetical protein